jgi:DNA-binding transcriptional LysR family regulator
VTCQLTLPLIAEFEAGAQDVVIVKQDPTAPQRGARPLWRERLVWVAAPALEADFARAAQGGRPLPLVLSPAPCVYRSRATDALDAAHVAWSGVFTSPSFAGLSAAVRAGLGYAVMPRGMVPQGLAVLDGWPRLAEAEIALLQVARPSPAVQALAEFLIDRVGR